MKVNQIIGVAGMVVFICGIILMMMEEVSMPLNILGAVIAGLGFCIAQYFPENPRWFSILQCITALIFMIGMFLGTRVFTENHAPVFCVLGGAIFPVALALWGQSKGFKTKRRLFDNPRV